MSVSTRDRTIFPTLCQPLSNGLLDLAEDPIEIRSTFDLDYSDEYKRRKMQELVRTGTVSTRGWGLSYLTDWGDTQRQIDQCLLYDGTYYRPIVESSEEVTRDTWAFYVDWTVDEPSADSDVATFPVDSLSEQDSRIIDVAVTDLPSPDRRVGPPDDYDWAVQYHAGLDPSASDLVPNPPFEYVRTEDETFGAVAERIPVKRTNRTISAEAIGTSEAAFEQFARQEFADADLSPQSLTDETRPIVDEITEKLDNLYEEEPPPSDGLEAVLEQLGIAEDLRPHDEYQEYTWFRGALAEYVGQWYTIDLNIHP